jgi:hypothetical protein
MVYHRVAAVLRAISYCNFGILMFLYKCSSFTMIFQVHGLYILCEVLISEWLFVMLWNGCSVTKHDVELQQFYFSHSFIHSIGMCRMRQFLAVLRSFFHSSLLHTFSWHCSPPAILPFSPTSFCHLFHGLPLGLFGSKIHIRYSFGNSIFFHSLYMSKTNIIHVTLWSLLWWVF